MTHRTFISKVFHSQSLTSEQNYQYARGEDKMIREEERWGRMREKEIEIYP